MVLMDLSKQISASYCLVTSMVIILFLSACNAVDFPTPERSPNTPIPPREIGDLPRNAQISCHNDPVLDRGAITLWSLPGLEPVDPESNPTANRGQRIGSLFPCTPIAITDIAWSETDQEFYLFVETSNMAEAGWVSLSLITIDE
jgi:hypothetical protein